jgi:short-subunit dehydrogenase
MPVALITDASTGIGLATALHFGRHGHDVWAGVRIPSAATELRDAIETERLPVRLVVLDVDDAGSVQRGVAEVQIYTVAPSASTASRKGKSSVLRLELALLRRFSRMACAMRPASRINCVSRRGSGSARLRGAWS